MKFEQVVVVVLIVICGDGTLTTLLISDFIETVKVV